MKDNFVAIDFETSYGHIPCSIGIVEFVNGTVTNKYYSLIKPIDLKFSHINTSINGIKLEDVINEREFDIIWEDIKGFVSDRLLVAHNSSTDITVLKKTLTHYNIPIPNFESVCTLNIAKTCVQSYLIDDFKLSTLAKLFKIDGGDSHNALDDAITCGNLFLNLLDNRPQHIEKNNGGEESEKHANNQITRIQNLKALSDKAINSLKGILIGINLDGTVNKAEINELRRWVVEHKMLINRNPFHEFMTVIENTLEENEMITDIIEDLIWLCQKYENDSFYYSSLTADLQILQGICHGILADGIINEKEIGDLNKWLNENEHLNSYYPYDEIRSLLESVLFDGKIDQEEKNILKAYFSQFVKLSDLGIANQIRNEISKINLSALCAIGPKIEFTNHSFCITGDLNFGVKEDLFKIIKEMGGIATNNVTAKTNFLIVGSKGSSAWAYSCYGRKVEKALNLRKSGSNIMIVREDDLIKAISN